MMFNIQLNKKHIELLIKSMRRERFQLLRDIEHNGLSIGTTAMLKADIQTLEMLSKQFRQLLRDHAQT